jgi:hypothetical protein
VWIDEDADGQDAEDEEDAEEDDEKDSDGSFSIHKRRNELSACIAVSVEVSD